MRRCPDDFGPSSRGPFCRWDCILFACDVSFLFLPPLLLVGVFVIVSFPCAYANVEFLKGF